MIVDAGAIISGMSLIVTAGVWMRLGRVIEITDDLKSRVLRLEAKAFKSV